MSLHRFEIFAAAAKYLNLSQASKELHISQPAISQQLKSLQDEFKIKLFEKSGRGIALTPQGRIFRRDIDPILLLNKKVRQKYGAPIPYSREESFGLGGSIGPATSLLPKLISQFRSRYPSINLRFDTEMSDDIEGRIAHGQLDIALVTEPLSSPLLVLEPYRRQRLVPFVSSRHHLATQTKLSLADLTVSKVAFSDGENGERGSSEIWASFI